MYREVKKTGRHLLFLTFIVVLLCTGTVTWAQDESPRLNLMLKAEKEVNTLKEGKSVIERVPLVESKPGDVIFYTLEYVNRGESAAVDAAIIDPLPEGTVYRIDSASGKDADISYSIDGGKTYQTPPVTYIEKKQDGTKETKIASPEMYTHIKWVIRKPIEPAHSGIVTFKVEVK